MLATAAKQGTTHWTIPSYQPKGINNQPLHTGW